MENNTPARDPLMEPIHGISLRDYAAIAMKMSTGVDENRIFGALGIDRAIWDEVNTLWPKRMQQDTDFRITSLYGTYFMEGATHPLLEGLSAETSAEGRANLAKLESDRYFYEELTGARQAAYEYGLDGAKWIQENFGISLGEFQAVGVKWMSLRSEDFGETMHFINYQQEKHKEYAAKFASELGGNIADDVEF